MFARATKKTEDSRKIDFDVEPRKVDSIPNQSQRMNEMNAMTSNNNQTSFFSEDAELKGSMSFVSKLEFNGRFEGEFFAQGPLVIGEKAVIKADISAAGAVIILGKVKGNITAKEKIELGPKAHLYGDVRSPKFM